MKVAPLGRDSWLASLDPLPSVALLRAPASTGKRMLAFHAAIASMVQPVDLRFWPDPYWLNEYGRRIDADDDRSVRTTWVEPELSIGVAREIVEWAGTAPLSSPFKVAVIRLSHLRADGTTWRASGHTCAALLKTLEEPPRSTRFILLATEPVPVMVRSRALELTAGLLPVDVLTEILIRKSDLSPAACAVAARNGGGRVSSSLASVESSVRAVVDVLTHLVARDQVALTEKMRTWTDEDTEMLVWWAHEVVSGQERVFAGSGAPKMSRLAAERVLAAVSRVRGARPRLVLGAVAALAEK